MVSIERLKDFSNYVDSTSFDFAVSVFGISTESGWRYLRLLKQLEDEPEGSVDMPSKHTILFVDIETSPSVVATYRMWKTNIFPDGVLEDWFMISWSAKWLGEDNMMHDVMNFEEFGNGDDKRICSSLWDLLDEAKVVIAHNLNGFDDKKINTRLLLNGFRPPSPYKKVDTLTAVRNRFGFNHNGLDPVNQALGIGEKSQDKGFMYREWLNARNGDKTALDRIETYNENDSLILEELYVAIRPWIPSHPNMALFNDDVTVEACHKCGSTHITPTGNLYYTSIGAYDTFVCNECESYSHKRKSEFTTRLSGGGL